MQNHINFAIGIPTLNRKDLLTPALMFYHMDFPGTKIMVLDNGNQDIKIPNDYITQNHIFVCKSDKNIGVAASWNFIIKKAFLDPGIAYVAMLNDDIYWGIDQETLRVILYQYCLQSFPYILLPNDEKYDWSVFVISREVWEAVGAFDMNFFPAYFEDRDYLYRAKLAEVSIVRVLPGPARFVTSGTAQKNNSVIERSEQNRQYYIKKWGGEPGQEVYTIPFDGGEA